jgi:hypothetical protein
MQAAVCQFFSVDTPSAKARTYLTKTEYLNWVIYEATPDVFLQDI